MDFDSIPNGVDFRDDIKETLKRAKVVVAIIGADWSGGREAAPRRIDDPADFVRLEIASALENGIPIIPVLVNNTPMPEAKNLPAELEGLAFRNGLLSTRESISTSAASSRRLTPRTSFGGKAQCAIRCLITVSSRYHSPDQRSSAL